MLQRLWENMSIAQTSDQSSMYTKLWRLGTNNLS